MLYHAVTIAWSPVLMVCSCCVDHLRGGMDTGAVSVSGDDRCPLCDPLSVYGPWVYKHLLLYPMVCLCSRASPPGTNQKGTRGELGNVWKRGWRENVDADGAHLLDGDCWARSKQWHFRHCFRGV
jgi:hypothetical protein